MSSPSKSASPARQSGGQLLALLIAGIYVLFTLLPDSNSLMVQWSWVFIWQVGLVCAWFWLLAQLWQQQGHWLGNGWDWWVGVLVLGVLLSTVLAEFPMQARWYSWAFLCHLAALYALNHWLTQPDRRGWLLRSQGYLTLAFIGWSLILWVSQTFLPELARLQAFRQFGVHWAFEFSRLDLFNWAPIGHQNYVAGYLLLALPLLVGLALGQPGWQRWLWWGGVGLGMVDLYTTSSRTAWAIALLGAIGAAGLLLWRSTLPRRWVGVLGGGGILAVVILILANDRLRSSVGRLFSGQAGGDFFYRLVTITTGWEMGWSRPWTGVGPGGVLLLFQKYRPSWAGQEAEIAFQLHSTPAHLWAELGVWSVVALVGAIALVVRLTWRGLRTAETQTPRLLIGGILVGLAAYSLFSLADYQLDNLCISGTLLIYLTVLLAEFRPSPPDSSIDVKILPRRSAIVLSLGGLGVLLAGILWLVPVHRAWWHGNQGFAALGREDVSGLIKHLKAAHQLAPWEPYYPYQLGWNLGNLSLRDREQAQWLIQGGIDGLQQGNQAAPYQEFGRTNLGWLLLTQDPKSAMQSFIQAARLVPAKRGMFYGLGVSLLVQNQPDLAMQAFTLEVLRDPIFITSPIWKLPDFQPYYSLVCDRLDAQLTRWLQAQPSTSLTLRLRQIRGSLRWWRGNLPGAAADWQAIAAPISQLLLDLAPGKSVSSVVGQLPANGRFSSSDSGKLAIAAWLDAAHRLDWLRQAWIVSRREIPTAETLQTLADSMTRSANFDQWLKRDSPSQTYRRERSGFGQNSRHVEGSVPVDFMSVVENQAIATFFPQLFPDSKIVPELDRLLQPQRDAFLQSLETR